MTTNEYKENSSEYGIEKYTGSYEQDDLGVTQIPTETILAIRNMTHLALFTFLASRPSDWKLNAKHLAAHFDCNKEKIYNAIDSLIALGFLTRTQLRDQGKFVRYHYRLHLRQKTIQNVQLTPCPEKPDTVKPDTENPDTYKTKKLKNKESKTTTTKKSSSEPSDKLNNQIISHKLESDPRSDDAFIQHAFHHIQNNSDKTLSQYQRIKGLLTILRNLKSVGEHFSSKGFIDSETKRMKEEKAKAQEAAHLKAQDEMHAKRMEKYNDAMAAK